jgi:hypothetical protein
VQIPGPQVGAPLQPDRVTPAPADLRQEKQADVVPRPRPGARVSPQREGVATRRRLDQPIGVADLAARPVRPPRGVREGGGPRRRVLRDGPVLAVPQAGDRAFSVDDPSAGTIVAATVSCRAGSRRHHRSQPAERHRRDPERQGPRDLRRAVHGARASEPPEPRRRP